MAQWMRIQVDEERAHAIKFVDFVNERGGRVMLQKIDQPKVEWANPLEAFKEAYDHECLISQKINDLVDLSVKHNDHAANTFLQWFVTEQVEEEANASAIVAKLELVGNNGMGILMMDQQLGQRTAAPEDAG
jgi:ferritin